jgi:hypothetical protein
MNKLLDYLEPFHQLKPIAELGYWGRHQRDQHLRKIAGVFLLHAVRWTVITGLLLGFDAVLPRGYAAASCAVLGSVALSFVLVIGTTAAAFVLGAKIRTA